jgi:hypothetical protein
MRVQFLAERVADWNEVFCDGGGDVAHGVYFYQIASPLSTSFFKFFLSLRRVMRFAMVRDSLIDLERRQQGHDRPPGPKLVRL